MTYKTKTQLDTLYADNTSGAISAADGRDFIDSTMNVVNVTAQITTTLLITRDHNVVLCNATTAGADITVTLPAASGCTGWVKTIVKTDAGTDDVIIDADASEKINGDNTKTLTAQYDYLTIVCDGAAWWIIASVITPP
jgi:hypothetical protein